MKKILIICLFTTSFTLFSNNRLSNNNNLNEGLLSINFTEHLDLDYNTTFCADRKSNLWFVTCTATVTYKGQARIAYSSVAFGDTKEEAIARCKSNVMAEAYNYINENS